jgi:DNA (cytosine-5)-methyltransferase 1
MTHGSLFSGIGGFDLAAEWMGWENVFHCEWNPFCQKVLKHYWPNSISYDDITKTDFNVHRGTIDVLSGGFPCQPYSMAGKRLGKEDSRHLWPQMLRVIREVQPTWVVGENVLGLVNWSGGLVFHEVQVDLEAAGYQVQPYVLPAAAVGAPHRRDRVWFVAYLQDNGRTLRQAFNERRKSEQNNRNEIRDIFVADGNKRDAADTESERYESFNTDRATIVSAQTSPGLHGRCSNSIYKSWAWDNFPTQSPVCSGNDGIPDRLDSITFPKWRNESIKGYGNAVVPQVVYAIFKSIQEYEQHQQGHTMGD